MIDIKKPKAFSEKPQTKKDVLARLFPGAPAPVQPARTLFTENPPVFMTPQAPPVSVAPIDGGLPMGDEVVEEEEVAGPAVFSQIRKALTPTTEKAPKKVPGQTDIVLKPKKKEVYTAAELKELGLDG